MQEESRDYLGSSEIAAAVGYGHYNNAYDVWAKLTNRRRPTPPTPAMERGILLEPIIRDHILPKREDVAVVSPPPGHVRHPDMPYLGTTPDGGIRLVEWEKPGLLEIKTVNSHLFPTYIEEGLPTDHIMQLQFGMGLLNKDRGAFAIHCADTWETLVFGTDFDPSVFAWLEREGKRFWTEFVEADKAPPDLLMPLDEPPIKPCGGTLIKRDDPAWEKLMDEADAYLDAKELIKIWDDAKEKDGGAPGLKNRVLELMKGAKTVEGCGMRVTRVQNFGASRFNKDLVEMAGLLDPHSVLDALDTISHDEVSEEAWMDFCRSTRINLDDDRFYKTGPPFEFPKLTRKEGV